MGSTLSDSQYNIIIMSSLPESYRPTLQTITAAEWTNAVLGASLKKMKVDDFIAFPLEEAQHRVINDDQTKSAESALAAHGKKSEKRGWGHKGKKPEKSTSGPTCKNSVRVRVRSGYNGDSGSAGYIYPLFIYIWVELYLTLYTNYLL